MVVGTDTGVYFKSYSIQGIRKVLNCENVSQIAVLDKYHILLVLSGKSFFLFGHEILFNHTIFFLVDKTLKAYPLDSLNNPTMNGKAPERLGQELGQHVNYFQVGVCNNKDLVVFKKKKNTTSIFTALEPLYDLRNPKNQKYITQKAGFMMGRKSNHSWFKKYNVRHQCIYV